MLVYYNHMIIEEKILFQIINMSQFRISQEIDWKTIDLEALYKEALHQSVLGLVASEIPEVYSDNKWIEAKYRQKSSYVRYCHEQDELVKIMNSASIPFVILKGNASSISYTDPSLRMMGDIDFLVPQDAYSKTKELLSSVGYSEGDDNGRHCHFRKNCQEFEVHHHFSHFEDIDIESYLIYGLNSREIVSFEGHEFPMLPKLANGLVLLDHFRRHLLSAVGLRHVVDWMMYVYKNLDDDFWDNEFKQVVQEKGLYNLAITLTRMCQIYLGLPESITWCKYADEDVCHKLMSVVMNSGNFGSKNAKGRNIESVSTSIKRQGLFQWLQYTGEHNWKSYHKHHWLKPLCWFYQIFRYAKQGIKAGRNKELIRTDFLRSKERYELLKKLNIS